ncbi:zinc transporter 4 isoform X1 [Stegostoma tigrinum]|uniref:zinc transporter 4 isoform X1 n=1 Tax=Stegostoma tigrinum TaxID=3053191 RepID=UPI0028701991|nr:zinc transporter 4 isoform X1 [Stegostoma tigrinum]XP_059495205.1 zinc transporter 4 isoform X1 [Stegostoma tigrinum]
MARPPWRCFSSFLREERASSVDTAGLALPEAIGEEDEDELPALSGANQLRMVLQDEAAICNGAGADSNPEPGAGLPEELPPDTAANEQTCHRCSKTSESVRQKTVRRKLWIAMTLYSVFTAGEFIGGYLSNSLAVMTDAVHMLADVLGIAASLVALFLAAKPPSSRFTFGLHRFEALAAVLSVMLIYAVTIGLIYEAVQRTIHKDFEIQADVMIIIAAIGVAVNLIMGVLLNQSSHMHSHARCQSEPAARGDQRNNTNHSHKAGSLAVRAAFIHALGDLVQSIGVLMAAYIIRFKPQYKIADPICTYIFSFLVLCTTFPILRDTSLIFLEGTPRHLDVHRLRDTLLKIDDVHSVQRLNVWSLTVGKTAAIVHLKLIPESFSRWEDVQCQVQQIMLYTFGMHQCTVQVQVFKETGNNACNKCRSLQA